MKIVFATLHVRDSAQAVSLAAGCLAAALPRRLRDRAVLVDLFPEQSLAVMANRIATEDPDLVALPTYVWNRRQVVALARHLSTEKPGLTLVAGGPEATGDPTGLAAEVPGLLVMRGEGERGFPQLVAALEAGRANEDLPGVILSRAGELVRGPEPVDAPAGDDYPSPWLTGVLKPRPGGGVLWETARGCAFSCDYCFDALDRESVLHLDWARLEAELDLFVAAGVSQVWVLDSTFNFPPARGRKLLELLLTRAPQLHYHLEAKAEFLDRQISHLLGQLSCSVQIGLQSTNAAALKTIHRPLDLDHLVRQVHLLESAGVIYGFDLIYGLPEDDYAGFRSSLDTALTLAPNHVHIFPLAVLPGTRLARNRERYRLQAQPTPPYRILASASWSARDLQQAGRLKAAVDLFYNTGRAVAFFPALLKLFNEPPSRFLEDFSRWLADREAGGEAAPDVDQATAAEALRLQKTYLRQRLAASGKLHLTFALEDLLRYHFHYAETLLGPPTDPWQGSPPAEEELWATCWLLAPQVRLVSFTYEIVDLMDMEDFDLQECAKMFRPVGSVGLFVRRDDEVYCESLSEEFYDFLRRCDGKTTPAAIFAGSLPRSTAAELVSFAVAEGLLQRKTATVSAAGPA